MRATIIVLIKLLFLIVLCFQTAWAQTTKISAGAQYENIIIRAEQFLAQKNYRQAKAEYENALKLDLKASYPKMKLQQIKQFYVDPQDENRFTQFVKKGDQFFAAQEYDNAREQYEWALILKPEEIRLQEKITESEELKTLLIQKRKDYNRSISIADSLYLKKNYQQAINEYLFASGLLPLERYPRMKMEEINKIYTAARSELSAYEKIIAEADKAYMVQDYISALAGYRKAKQMKPTEAYPANMIQRISDAQAANLTTEETYSNLIRNAGNYFSEGDLERALTYYEQAARLKPAELLPKNRIKDIETLLASHARASENLAKALEAGDQLFIQKDYVSALLQYEAAMKIDGKNNQATERIATIKGILREEADFNTIIDQAEKLFAQAAYADARKKFEEALVKRPGHTQSLNRISEIDATISRIAEREQTYRQVIAKADGANKAKEYEAALEQYQIAVSLKPNESYPAQQINSINLILQKAEESRRAYENAIASGDQRFSAGQFRQAIESYQEALSHDASKTYGRQKIEESQSLISKAETDAAYEKALTEASNHEENNRLSEALKFYSAAGSLKPNESLPKEKVAALGAILEAEKRKVREAYEKAITDGNRYYESKVFDQAIEAYLSASQLMPDVAYPAEMVAKIRKYLQDRLLADLVNDPAKVPVGDERKFNFKPIEMRLKRNNYVVIKMKFETTDASRFFLNYGMGDQRSGGIVVRNPGGSIENEFMIRISAQDRWYRLDNNWLSIFTENAGVEVTQLRISSGD